MHTRRFLFTKPLTAWLVPLLAVLLAGIPPQLYGDTIHDPGEGPRFTRKLDLQGEYGFVMPTNEYLRGEYEGGEPVEHFGSAAVSFGWQTRGDQLWQRIYGNPAWGLGLYHAAFGRPEDLGAPWAIYGYYEGPFKRWRKLSVNYHYRMGMSAGWVPFDAQDNPYQISLGSSRAVYASLRFYLQYRLSPRADLTAGISLSHFSNGSTVKPNKGINMISPQVGISFHSPTHFQEYRKADVPAYRDNWEWVAVLTAGRKQVVFDTTNAPREIDRRYIGVNYNIIGFSTTILRQFTHKSKFGVGLDLLYDESINARIDLENGEVIQNTSSFTDRLAIGVYPSYELVVNRLSVLVQGGVYVLRKKRSGQIPAFYQRIGLKYHVFRNFFLGINVKAYNMKVADFIEWNAGYRIRWDKW